MRVPTPALLCLALLATSLAGCAGAGTKEVSAAFTATPLDPLRSFFRFRVEEPQAGATYDWDLGDRSPTKTGAEIQYSYAYPGGAYKVKLTARAAQSASPTSQTLDVLTGDGTNEPPLLYLAAQKRRVVPGEPVLFDASSSRDADGDPLFFAWDFNANLDPQRLNDLENLGNQAYGRYPSGKPAQPTRSDGPEGTTPAGRDRGQELAEATQRFLSRAGIEPLDAGHGSGPHETRNKDFDGRIEDTSSMQYFAYPSSATYYVHLRVEDIKGATSEGFLRILVEDSVAPASNSTWLNGTLKPVAFEQLRSANLPDSHAAWGFPLPYDFPAASNLTLRFASDPAPADGRVALYLCGKDQSLADCKTSAGPKLEAGASGRPLAWQIGADQAFPYTYRLWIVNEGDTLIEYAFPVDSRFDLNPWAKEEAGFASGG